MGNSKIDMNILAKRVELLEMRVKELTSVEPEALNERLSKIEERYFSNKEMLTTTEVAEYLGVVSLVTEDEDTGVKKFSPQTIYVNAPSTKEADRMLRQHMSSSVTEWKIKSIAETKVLGVLGYKQ